MTAANSDGTAHAPSPEAPRRIYERREEEERSVRDGAHRASMRIGTLRLLTFVAAVTALFLFDVWHGTRALTALAFGAVLLAAFALEVAVHRRIRRRELWHEALMGLFHEGILRLERQWDALAALSSVDTEERPPRDHPFGRDLDVTGKVSLVRLLGPVTSERGRAILRSWLLRPASPEAVVERQQAVQELAPQLDRRMRFAASGRIGRLAGAATIEPFLDWAEKEPWILQKVWLRTAAYVLPASVVALVLGDLLLGWGPVWVAPAVLQAWLLRRCWHPITRDLAVIEDSGLPLQSYVPQLRVIEGVPPRAPALRRLTERIGSGSQAASARIAHLVRLLDTVASRRNLVYLAFAFVFMLDVHLAAALDRWRVRWGQSLRGWLEAAGEWESLAALGSLAHDHPDWCFPVFLAEGPAVLSARALGHPLIAPTTCVRNDVDVGPPGSFLLVTGSNMSGKSTLLRALGVNVVLATAGGPVCATSLELPPLRVFTGMHVEESLAEGVSLFMAELLRIKAIVRAADAPGAPVFYLLDEILRGTNTAERQIAARAVIRHLLAAGAIGAISTHDLTLAQATDLVAVARPVHFSDRVEQHDGTTTLTFDYKLRPGLATTTNALALLEAVGLGGLPL